MCCGCWEEKGAPSTVTPEILLAAQFIKANEEMLGSGPCHVCIDDENVEDHNLERCREHCGEPDPFKRGPEFSEFWAAEQECCRVAIMLLRSLDEDERVTVMGIVDGCLVPPGV